MATKEQPKVSAEKAPNNEKNEFEKIMDLMSGYDKLFDDVSRCRYQLSVSAVKLDAARKQLASLEMELDEQHLI